MNNLLTVIDWNKYIFKKKKEFIDNLDNISKVGKLHTTSDKFKFNDVLKNDIVKINIFNMSYISFMMFKFLESTFIPSEIILNVIEIYTDDELNILLNKNKNKNINYKIETHNYIKILKYIISAIIDFVVKTELGLNIQCLLMTHFINKIHNTKITSRSTDTTATDTTATDTTATDTTSTDTTATDTTATDTTNISIIFRIFSNINKDVITNIKSSTLILLFLNLVEKFNTTHDETKLLYFINEYHNTNFLTFINKKHTINKKTNLYLDTFMLDITKYFLIDNNINNIHNIINPDIYLICNKYILNITDLIFNNFENIYTVLETHLLESINMTEAKKKKLSYLKNIINNIVDIEIDNIKKLFI